MKHLCVYLLILVVFQVSFHFGNAATAEQKAEMSFTASALTALVFYAIAWALFARSRPGS